MFSSKDKLGCFVLMHLVVFVYGFTGILGGLITLSAVKLVWLRIIIAFVAIFLFIILKKQSLRISKKALLELFGAGLIIALHWVTFYWAIKESNISITVVCLSSATFFTAVLDPIINRRKFLLYELIFGVLVIIGLAYIFKFQPAYFFGICIGIFSAFLSALFTVVNSSIAKKYNPLIVPFYEIISGIIVIAIYLLATNQLNSWVFSISGNDWLYLSILGVACTAFAFVAAVKVQQHISAFTFTLSINLEPVYTIILAYFIFGEKEQMNLEFYLGTLFIVLILFLNAYIKSRQNTMQLKQS